MPDLAIDHLRRGLPVHDHHFDRLFPSWAKRLSPVHWTPVAVARRAAQILAPGRERILDIGSGVGKLCLVGALTTSGLFYGIEQRQRCIEVAREAARRIGTKRARFVHGNMRDLDWGWYDGFYLYNPFVENLYPRPSVTPELIDEQYERSRSVFDAYVRFVVERLRDVRVGTRVATYHGFGGDVPEGFEQIVELPMGSDLLEVWVKTSRASSPMPR